MLGTCLVIGDGILTPAISVLSIMAGIQSKNPPIQSSVVIWVSAAILVLLFPLQQFGTHHIGFMFSPILLIWFVSIPCVGVYNILTHYPAVFKAVSPHYIFEYFIRNQRKGLVALGGVVLCITGTKAAVADLGHFNKRSNQLAFACLVYPSAIITYAGETASPECLFQVRPSLGVLAHICSCNTGSHCGQPNAYNCNLLYYKET